MSEHTHVDARGWLFIPASRRNGISVISVVGVIAVDVVIALI